MPVRIIYNIIIFILIIYIIAHRGKAWKILVNSKKKRKQRK